VKITKVKTGDFKGYSRELSLSGTVVLCGPNGSGKTGLQKAIEVAITGYDSDLGKKPKYTMQHISGSMGWVEITIQCDDGEVVVIKRTYTRDKKGNVKMDVRVLPKMDESTSGDYEARIKNIVGSFPIMFDLASFLHMKDSEYRDFFFSKCKVDNWDKEKIFDKMIKGTAGLLDEDKLQSDTITVQLGEAWHDELSIKDNLETVIETLGNIKNRAQGEVRGNVGASEAVEERKVEDKTSKTIPMLKEEIAKYEEDARKVSADIKINKDNAEKYDKKEAEISKVIVEIADIKKGDFDATLTAEDYAKKISELDAMSPLPKNLYEIDVKMGVASGKCPIGVECDKLDEYKKSIPNLKKEREEIKEKMDKKDEQKSVYVQQQCHVGEYKHLVENLDRLQKEMMDMPKPVSSEELETQLQSLDTKKSELESEKNVKIQVQAAEKMQGDIKSARLVNEAKLNAVKVLIGVVGKDGILGEIIKSILGPFADKINGLLQKIDDVKNFKFNLEDEITGKPIFQFGWKKDSGFVPFHALSNGERALFGAAIMVALITQQNPKLRVLLIDNIEAVDDSHRDEFVNACFEFEKVGQIDNVLLAGCMQYEGGVQLGMDK